MASSSLIENMSIGFWKVSSPAASYSCLMPRTVISFTMSKRTARASLK
jgi:hypothetical protein